MEMLPGYRLFVAIVLLLGPAAVVGEYCIDCRQHLKFPCPVNVTGYYCEQGSEISEHLLAPEDYRTSTIGLFSNTYDECTPYPYRANFIKTFCCFYSPKLGCQLAVNPDVHRFENRPMMRCLQCSEHCQCITAGATPGQSWTGFCLLGSLALSQSMGIVL